tara:strand:- start:468 stop:812 length:345 start_codon:yes stop_codon:yes gene_type:complete
MKNKNYKSISEVSKLLKIKQHVIRYWDSQFDGISTRMGARKRRFFSNNNIKKLQTLKKLLHTNDKPHHSIELARKIINENIIEKKFILPSNKSPNITTINKLKSVSDNLKKLVK